MKKCTKCGADDLLGDFIHGRCRSCKNEYQRIWRNAHPEEMSALYAKMNKKKDAKLGMPFGTAQNRLWNQVMFSLVVACGRDTCFRCGEKIVNWEDVSLDHKEDWLNDSVDLYWDISNVAFSHRKCNRRSMSSKRIASTVERT